jgi:hypothetical protein
MSALGLGIRELFRCDRRRQERGQGEIGDGEPLADEIPARLELRRKALTGGAQLLEGNPDAALVDAER